MILAAFHRTRIPEIVLLLIAIALPAISQKKVDKPAVDTLYQQGIRSLQKGDLEAARAAFEKVVLAAANDAKRSVQVIEKRGAARDHPALMGVPESRYLKCLIVRAL